MTPTCLYNVGGGPTQRGGRVTKSREREREGEWASMNESPKLIRIEGLRREEGGVEVGRNPKLPLLPSAKWPNPGRKWRPVFPPSLSTVRFTVSFARTTSQDAPYIPFRTTLCCSQSLALQCNRFLPFDQSPP